MKNYTSVTASPSKVEINHKQNLYKIQAAGADFFHAEDSYAAIYLAEKIKAYGLVPVRSAQPSQGSCSGRAMGIGLKDVRHASHVVGVPIGTAIATLSPRHCR